MSASESPGYQELVSALEAAGCTVRGKSVVCGFHEDHNASGSIYQGSDGRSRYKCHGCDAAGDDADIIAKHTGRPLAEVLKERDAESPTNARNPFRNGQENKQHRSFASVEELSKGIYHKTPEAIYRYTDSTCRNILAVLRLPGKQFRQARWADDGWESGGIVAPLPLYGQVRLAKDRSSVVVVTEGEKDVDTLAHFGLLATTAPMGADAITCPLSNDGKPGKVDWSPLAGRSVVLWGDDDEPGRNHMVRVARCLARLNPPPTIRMIRDEDRHGCKDAAEMFEKIGEGAARAAIRNAIPYNHPHSESLEDKVIMRQEPVKKTVSNQNDIPGDTEARIANFLAGGDLNNELRWRAHASERGWSVWDGCIWKATTDAIPLTLQAYIRHAVADGLKARTIEPKSVQRLETASGMRGIATLLSAYPNMKLPEEIDPPGMITFPSGCYDLHADTLTPHDSSRAITRMCPVDPGEKSDLWDLIESHLRKCLGSDYTAVHRYLGSSLLGRGADRCLLWMHGPGGDGKSTFAKVLRAALGDHAAIVPAEFFAEGARGAHSHELGSGLAGARLGIGLELGTRLDWKKIMGLSGSDEQKSKRLHGRSFEYSRPPCLFLISNDPPMPPSKASAERLMVAKLVPPDEHDERLMAVLKDGGVERDQLASACLSWLLDGCRQYLAEGLGPYSSLVTAPAGLEKWWAYAIQEKRIIPKTGWTSLANIMVSVRADMEATGQDVPIEREVSAFLITKVLPKRFNHGRRYNVTLRDAS